MKAIHEKKNRENIFFVLSFSPPSEDNNSKFFHINIERDLKERKKSYIAWKLPEKHGVKFWPSKERKKKLQPNNIIIIPEIHAIL